MKDSIAARISAFNEVRDLPFYVATQGEEDCCCSTKAVHLERKLSALGLQCRHRLCWFTWESLGLPASVLALPHEERPSHQYLEVLVPESRDWIVVDPTWDSGLREILPVVEWDSVSATPVAVPVLSVCTDKETAQIFTDCESPELTAQYFESQGPFLRELNQFLQAVRGNLA